VTLPQAAVAFTRAHPAVTSVLLGMRSPDEVAEDMALLRAPVPADLWSELTDEGLLQPRP
jgi:D-threo-aldose 1-dehydrogenase